MLNKWGRAYVSSNLRADTNFKRHLFALCTFFTFSSSILNFWSSEIKSFHVFQIETQNSLNILVFHPQHLAKVNQAIRTFECFSKFFTLSHRATKFFEYFRLSPIKFDLSYPSNPPNFVGLVRTFECISHWDITFSEYFSLSPIRFCQSYPSNTIFFSPVRTFECISKFFTSRHKLLWIFQAFTDKIWPKLSK